VQYLRLNKLTVATTDSPSIGSWVCSVCCSWPKHQKPLCSQNLL